MSRIKKIVLILIIFAVIVGGGSLFVNTMVNNAKAELNAFIEPMYYDLASHDWSAKTFNNYLCASIKDQIKTAKILDEMSVQLKKSGKIKSYKGIVNFSSQISSQSGSARAIVEINFENLDRYFDTVLMKENKKWCLYEVSYTTNKGLTK